MAKPEIRSAVQTKFAQGLKDRRYGDLIAYLNTRIELLSKAVDRLLRDKAGQKPKKGDAPMLYFFKALRVMGVVSEWAAKALEDGKITAKEGAELVDSLGKVLDLPTEIEIPVK